MATGPQNEWSFTISMYYRKSLEMEIIYVHVLACDFVFCSVMILLLSNLIL